MKKQPTPKSKSEIPTFTKEKPKKITVKFFLHTSVQPEVEGKQKRYPLYMLITYNRKNTMLRSYYGRYYKDLKEIEKVHYPGLLDLEERVVQKSISYEVSKQKEVVDLKGLHKKYVKYCIGIDTLLSRYLKNVLWLAVIRSEPQEYKRGLNFSDPDLRFETIYEMCSKLYPDLDKLLSKDFQAEVQIYEVFMKRYQGAFFQYSFPTVIEWLDGSVKQEYTHQLEKMNKGNQVLIQKSMDFIQKIVDSSLSELW